MQVDRGFVRSLTTGVPMIPLEEIVVRPPWQRGAACHAADASTFYDTTVVTDETAAFCDRCTVRGVCLDWALLRGEHGVWGGTGEAERKAMRAARRKGA